MLMGITVTCQDAGAATPVEWLKLPIADLIQKLGIEEVACRAELNAYLRALIAGNRSGPTPGPLPLAFGMQRALCGLDTLRIVDHGEMGGVSLLPRPPDWPMARLLEWLLIDNWAARYPLWVRAMAASMASGLPLNTPDYMRP
jgi:hypothetical protein